MDASLSTPSLDSAKPPDEVLTLADHLPEDLNPKLYTALVKVMHVYELAPDEKTWQPKVRWFLTACTGVPIKVDPKDRGRVIGLASTIIVQHLSSNEEWLGLYLASVEEAKVQAALDEKAYDKDLAPTPAPKSRPKPPARAPAGHALPYLLTPMPDAGGGMTQMAQPAGADLRTRFAGVGISAVRECDTFGPPAPLRRPADSPPPIKGKSEFRNHKGVLETPALIGEDMTESVKMAGLKDTPQITRTNAKPSYGVLTVESVKSVSTQPSTSGKSTYSKDEQSMHDTIILRKHFTNEQIGNEFTASQIVDIGMMLLKGKSSSELEQLAREDPDVFEVFTRLGAPRARATGASSSAGSSRSSRSSRSSVSASGSSRSS